METPTVTKPVTVTPTALASITTAEIDTQIATAKKFPRELSKFRQTALSMATADTETAERCFYKLKRKSPEGDKVIEGPSIRLAEICASAWGNLRFGSRVVGEEEGFIITQGIAHDLETNVCSTMENRRRITNKQGQRFNADMIVVTANASCAIAARNALFKVVPFVYVKQIMESAKKVAIGNAATLGERRQKMVQSFGQMGVTVEQLLEYTEKSTLEDMGLTEIEDLIGAFNAIKDGDATIEETFAKKEPEAPKRASDVKADTPVAPAPQSETPVTPQAEAHPAPVAAPETAGSKTDKPALPEPPANVGNRVFQDTIARVKRHDGGNIGIQTNKNAWINTRDLDMGAAAEAVARTGKPMEFTMEPDGTGWKLVSLKAADA